MPPRRSTRSARSSVEPQPTIPSKTTSKRKRITEEKENLAKPALSNGKPTLKEVLESDDGKDERDGEHREVKRKRPSPKLDEDEDESEEEVKPKRTSRKPVSSKGRRTMTLESDEDEDEGDYVEDVKPTLKARKPPTKRASKASTARKASSSSKSSSAGKLSSRSAKSASLTDSDEDSMEVDPKPANNKKKATYASSVEDLYASDSEPQGAALSSKKKLAPPLSSKQARAASTPTTASTPERSLLDNESESEPEHSLLDPIRPPTQSPSKSQINSQPKEEPKGPKSRLVIHKMALVNFKSYAGRQEIGPFHKVNFLL